MILTSVMSPPNDRYSEASTAELVLGAEEKARREARNGVRQFDKLIALIETAVHQVDRFRLRVSTILDLHRAAMEGLDLYAGNFRPADVKIIGSSLQPPPADQVPQEVEVYCDYINENWKRRPIHLAAYALWRLNWIHPFTDGNGRTARVVSYLVLSVRLGYRLPGTKTIPDLIAENKTPYYRSLEAADRNDLRVMEKYLEELLQEQLYAVAEAAASNGH
jgi:Fic family protein